MNIHEYQAKALLRSYRITTPRGEVVYTSKAAARVAEELGGQPLGREGADPRGRPGQGRRREDRQHARPRSPRSRTRCSGSTLVTAQTGPEGQRVSRVLVERASRIEREFYLSLVVDRDAQRIVVIASAEGGVDIEDVAAREPRRDPHRIRRPGRRAARLPVPQGRHRDRARQERTTSFTRLLKRMYRLFRDTDCLMLEVNPFIETEDGELVALDCKMSFDDNALFRQGDIVELRDFDEEDPKEVEATGHGLNYIALDGAVGCIVNGAGLAMGTMDAIVAPRRAPGELPRRRWRRQPREDRERVPHRDEGPERPGDPGEHLRGHQPVRLDRAGRGAGHARSGDRRADHRAARGHQRRRGPGHPGRERPALIQADDLDDAAAKAVARQRPTQEVPA